MLFTASLLGPLHERVDVESNPASSLVVSMGQVFNGIPSSLRG